MDLIEAGRQVYFFGVAVSGIAASTGENSFIRMGKPVHAIQEGHMQMIAAAGMTEEDVVVVFSLTGNTRDTCEAAALASQQGAKIISVTSYVNSQLARISDVVLADLRQGGDHQRRAHHRPCEPALCAGLPQAGIQQAYRTAPCA